MPSTSLWPIVSIIIIIIIVVLMSDCDVGGSEGRMAAGRRITSRIITGAEGRTDHSAVPAATAAAAAAAAACWRCSRR